MRQKATGTWNIRDAIIRANKASALTIGKLGAQAGIPWSDEIDEFEADLRTDMDQLNLSEDSSDM